MIIRRFSITISFQAILLVLQVNSVLFFAFKSDKKSTELICIFVFVYLTIFTNDFQSTGGSWRDNRPPVDRPMGGQRSETGGMQRLGGRDDTEKSRFQSSRPSGGTEWRRGTDVPQEPAREPIRRERPKIDEPKEEKAPESQSPEEDGWSKVSGRR